MSRFRWRCNCSIPAVENAIIVANATGGYEVGLELALEQIEERKMGKVFVVNRMDNDNADYDKTLEAIAENTDIKPVKNLSSHWQRRCF